MSTSADLLFEIGCEEIPARMLARALADLPAIVANQLKSARLRHGDVQVMGTPRRLAVIVRALAAKQDDLSEWLVGPPVAVAFGADGGLSKAGLGFAAKNGIEAGAITRGPAEGKKGEYALAQKFVAGQLTDSLLPSMLAQWITAVAWPKSMRWGWAQERFVRPVQWLLALYGTTVVPVAWRNVQAGAVTRGHRFLSSGELPIASASTYVDALSAAHVVVDPAARRARVVAELARIEREHNVKVRDDQGLIDEVQHLSEYPVGLLGEFAKDYLDVPAEIIVTAMRTHQRYFAVEDGSGNLSNHFVTMMGTVVADPSVVKRGNERVLAARLADAQFFFAEDQKQPLTAFVDKLKGVTFQAKLGEGAKTTYDKVTRISSITREICLLVSARDLWGNTTNAGDAIDSEIALAAAYLCKADLAVGVVGEFPELQGTMGKYYVMRAKGGSMEVPYFVSSMGVTARETLELGESKRTALGNAIEQHYWPKGAGGQLPTSIEAAVVAIADRIDTLVGCFVCGLVPSGSADPLGLRRAAIGMLTIILDMSLPLRVYELFLRAATSYPLALQAGAAWTELSVFMEQRLRGVLVEAGADAAAVDVALGANNNASRELDAVDIRARALALALVPSAVRIAFKRISNILDDATAKNEPIGEVNESAFVADAEMNLWRVFNQHNPNAALAKRDYAGGFAALAAMAPEIAAFFDKGGVMVMDPDPALRKNRLSLLTQIASPFAEVADFRKLGASS